MIILTFRRPFRAIEGVRDVAAGSVSGWLERCRRKIARWVARSRQRQALRDIAEANDLYLLKDIGISREEAFREADKRFWQP